MSGVSARAVVALLAAAALCLSCASPPRHKEDACRLFEEKNFWYRHSLKAQKRWGSPVEVILSFAFQESGFRQRARPPLKRFLGLPLPFTRPSNSFGYSQALKETWELYRRDTGRRLAQRWHFPHAADFIAWYNHQSAERLGLSKDDAENLYLAYHEGWGGYQRRTFLQPKKAWLLDTAKKVAARSGRYRRQLDACGRDLKTSHWLLRPWDLFPDRD